MKKMLACLGFTFGIAAVHLAMYKLDKQKVSCLFDDIVDETKNIIK